MLTWQMQGRWDVHEASGRAGSESGLALTSRATLQTKPAWHSDAVIRLKQGNGCTGASLFGQGYWNMCLQRGDSQGQVYSSTATHPCPRCSFSKGYEGARVLPAAQSPDAAEDWEKAESPSLPTSGMLFAYRRSWDLFPLAVFQPKPVLMLRR